MWQGLNGLEDGAAVWCFVQCVILLRAARRTPSYSDGQSSSIPLRIFPMIP